jgi:hypothetical protein
LVWKLVQLVLGFADRLLAVGSDCMQFFLHLLLLLLLLLLWLLMHA